MVSLRQLCWRLLETSVATEVNVFDFDDTLVRTTSSVYLTTHDGRSVKLTSHEFMEYDQQPGDQFDFSDFQQVINPTPIAHMVLKLQYAIRSLGHDNVFVLTARDNATPIRDFLSELGVDGIRVLALGNSDPLAKAAVIKNEILSRDVKLVRYYDDAPKYLVAVRNLKQDPSIPRDVQIIVSRVK